LCSVDCIARTDAAARETGRAHQHCSDLDGSRGNRYAYTETDGSRSDGDLDAHGRDLHSRADGSRANAGS
jgi:hypothetical protein